MNEIEVEIHHRDTEDTEGAQRVESLCAISVSSTVSMVNLYFYLIHLQIDPLPKIVLF
jgi:hypothetical protein